MLTHPQQDLPVSEASLRLDYEIVCKRLFERERTNPEYSRVMRKTFDFLAGTSSGRYATLIGNNPFYVVLDLARQLIWEFYLDNPLDVAESTDEVVARWLASMSEEQRDWWRRARPVDKLPEPGAGEVKNDTAA